MMKHCTHYVYTPSLVSKCKHYKFVNDINSLRQCKLVNVVCTQNLLMLEPITMKLGTRMSHDKSLPKQKLQVCKQQQTASGNVMLFAPITYLLMLDPTTMKLGTRDVP